MRDDGERSMESTTMSDDKQQDDFLSQMATSGDDESDKGEQPEKEEGGEEGAETGATVDKTDTTATPAADKGKEADRVPVAALLAERDKRQALERELAELRGKTSTTATPDKADTKEPATEPSFYEDPEGFVTRTVTKAQRQAEGRLFAALEHSERESNPDFDEVMEYVVAKVKENPALKQQIFSSPNPARAAFKLGKTMRDAEALQANPEGERERIRAEERAKLEAEFKQREQAKRKTDDEIPPDLASSRSASGAATPAPGAVFDELFKD